MSDHSTSTLRHAPAAIRNREPILEVLRRVAPQEGLVLEVASGSGEHAVFLAPRLNERAGAGNIEWQPTDPDAGARASIAAWTAQERVGHVVRPPIHLDATAPSWPVASGSVAMIVCINMIHIAPWSACLGLLRGAASVLVDGGVLYLYGPYLRDGVTTAEGNVAFDQSLRSRDAAWGVRDLGAVQREAESCGLVLREVVEMPANNLSVVFGR